jgi:hypothetical protein
MVDILSGLPVSNFVATQRAKAQLSRSVSETAPARARAARQEIIRSGQQRGFEPTIEFKKNVTSNTPKYRQEREFRISDEQVNDRFFDRIDDARSDVASRANANNSINMEDESNRLSTAEFRATESSRKLIAAADQRRQDTRAAEVSAQVQQQIDLQLADQRLVNAQNDPSQQRGSLVDIFA